MQRQRSRTVKPSAPAETWINRRLLASWPHHSEAPMTVTCAIRYVIDPFKRDQFET